MNALIVPVKTYIEKVWVNHNIGNRHLHRYKYSRVELMVCLRQFALGQVHGRCHSMSIWAFLFIT